MATISYSEEIKIENLRKLREFGKVLPPFCTDYFRAMKNQGRSSRTLVGYAMDLQGFFQYIVDSCEQFTDVTVQEMTIQQLEQIRKVDIEMYLEYAAKYVSEDGTERKNCTTSLARKLSAVKSLYEYFEYGEQITRNPAKLIKSPKIKKKTVEALDPGEVAQLLDGVESGDNLTDRQRAFHKALCLRDMAIISLLVGTGLRVSELVGLDIDHINFRDNSIKIIRKGGNEAILYLNDEVAETVKLYIENQRNTQIAKQGHEKALFLSNRLQRISVASVEKLVKKYSIATLKKDTHPHLYRSTFATNLLSNEENSVSIDVVADLLGHANLETTKSHYVKSSEERKRAAIRGTRLRKD